jgi:hypothetical protein
MCSGTWLCRFVSLGYPDTLRKMASQFAGIKIRAIGTISRLALLEARTIVERTD